MSIDVVIPTIGRPSLGTTVASLLRGSHGVIRDVIIVDDRPSFPRSVGDAATGTSTPDGRTRVRRLCSGGCGPAGARNIGWHASDADWIAFLDDDVVVPAGWAAALEADLGACAFDVAASQGRIVVPLPSDRRPTDWERNVACLEHAQWATADMAIRRRVLAEVGGFDERFPRAYREDSDLGLRITERGHRAVVGDRHVVHPAQPAPWHISIRKQSGNADDALMTRLHGRDWRRRAGAPRGRMRRHAAITAAGIVAAGAVITGRRRLATIAGAGWLVGTTELAVRRVAPGPRTPREIATMVVTSAVIPGAATLAWCRGTIAARRAWRRAMHRRNIDVVLFDRDGTLVADVPYNGDPSRVVALPTAREAIDRLRRQGIATGVVTNQSGVGRGLLAPVEVEAVNARVDALLGPFDVWLVCPHAPEAGCGCRKPQPGLILGAARALGAPVERCVVIGDIGSDVDAADAAGAFGILVPNAATEPSEIERARHVAPDLSSAVDMVLSFGTRR